MVGHYIISKKFALSLSAIILVSSLAVLTIANNNSNDSADLDCEPNSGEGSSRALVARAVNHFGLAILKQLHKKNHNGNTIYSPLSIVIILNMLQLGALEQSPTYQEISQALGYKCWKNGTKSQHDGMRDWFEHFKKKKIYNGTLSMANLVLVNGDLAELSSKYNGKVRKLYHASVVEYELRESNPGMPVNLDNIEGRCLKVGTTQQLVETINEWVRSRTNGRFYGLVDERALSPIEELTLILANAIHFKGAWLNKFPRDDRIESKFYNNGKTHSPLAMVPFMSVNKQFEFGSFSSADSEENDSDLAQLDCSVVDMPFELHNGQEFSMTIFLPNKLDGLANLIKTIDGPKLRLVYENLRPQRVQIFMPKFSDQQSLQVIPLLKMMGIKSLFKLSSDNLASMFTSGTNMVEVNKVIHKAKIEVNEYGVEASGATIASITSKSLPQFFKVDHPFMYILRHRDYDLPIFIGQIVSI